MLDPWGGGEGGDGRIFSVRVKLGGVFFVPARLPGASSGGGLGPPWPTGERTRRRNPAGRKGKRRSGGQRGLERGGGAKV